MTAQTGEPLAMADHAAWLVEIRAPGGVKIKITRNVAGGLQMRSCIMTMLAAKGIVNLRMAHQAVGHLRHVLLGDLG